jgi:hypothetical protein
LDRVILILKKQVGLQVTSFTYPEIATSNKLLRRLKEVSSSDASFIAYKHCSRHGIPKIKENKRINREISARSSVCEGLGDEKVGYFYPREALNEWLYLVDLGHSWGFGSGDALYTKDRPNAPPLPTLLSEPN